MPDLTEDVKSCVDVQHGVRIESVTLTSEPFHDLQVQYQYELVR